METQSECDDDRSRACVGTGGHGPVGRAVGRDPGRSSPERGRATPAATSRRSGCGAIVTNAVVSGAEAAECADRPAAAVTDEHDAAPQRPAHVETGHRRGIDDVVPAPVYATGCGRTGCLLRMDTRLKALMVIATQMTAEISSSVRASRAVS